MSMTTKYRRLRQRGLTLIEAAMVLAISTLVVAGIMTFFSDASISRKSQEAMGQLAQLQNAVRTVYAGQSSYSGLAVTDLINTRVIPTKMISGGTTLRHSFNSTIAIAAANVNGGTANGFSVTYSHIPAEACSKMSTQDLGTGVFSLTVGTTTFTSPPTPATAATACGTTNTTATMAWVFF